MERESSGTVLEHLVNERRFGKEGETTVEKLGWAGSLRADSLLFSFIVNHLALDYWLLFCEMN